MTRNAPATRSSRATPAIWNACSATSSITPSGTRKHLSTAERPPAASGIPVEDRDRVFDRFVRLDVSRDRAGGRNGLGLAIAREIVTAHRGGIFITDAEERGTTEFVWLPQREP
ncbi:ATP-binding protein [Amycolatopsis sp. cmx-4-83]|uniref:ATP-binding protein n=1 Tax=Amycolatopsis sp. cmx-4-83 TaxID=2790940 RepID=UPI00397E7F06